MQYPPHPAGRERGGNPRPLGAEAGAGRALAGIGDALVERATQACHRPPQQADGGWTAYVLINLAAMVFPLTCLALSRHVLGWDSALADNISANLVGLVLAFGARFVLFKRFVFRRPLEEPDPVITPV